ncbi:MAG: translation elongation factor Ts [Treponema sp.]|jgi:elongation factor Ts|nr:translation elongation factor Ts [Treponema sp.]
MAEISAADVKRLREKTGAGMMECKNALVSSGGDFEKAEKLLKEKGLAAIGKRADRATNEGKVTIKVKGDTAVLVELASETDFVARNPEFIALGEAIAAAALDKGLSEPTDELKAMVTDLATKIRENMSFKRIKTIKAGPNEYISSYTHNDGNIGVVVKAGAEKPGVFDSQEAKDFVFTIALNIAAFNPLALDQSKIDPAYIKEQEEIFAKQMEKDEKNKDKPAHILENILKGKVKKHLQDICLLDQDYVKDPSIKVSQAIADFNKKAGADISVKEYAYFRVGE